MYRFELLEPTSLQEAFSLLEEHGDDAKVMAGGTALVLLMKQRLLNPGYLVSIMNIPGLADIRWDPASGLTIGGLARHADVEKHPAVKEHYPALHETMHHVAQPRVRNMATLGGNLCHADPMQDPGSTLIAHRATVVLSSAAGERELPLEDFFVDYYTTAIEPNEILTAIKVPAPKANSGAAHIKFTPRSVEDYATVGVAAVVVTPGAGSRKIEDISIGFNSVAPASFRAAAAEDILRGKELTDELLEQAAQAAMEQADPTPDVRGSADYKRDMTGVFLKRAVKAALENVR